ncbi:MAG: hypothetical protein J1E29_09170, partial [Duncaniella sp.]|nr:hypothetical protein [Duncaniella sp.]
MKELITGRDLRDPVCTLSTGKAPLQHIVEVVEVSADSKQTESKSVIDDFDESMYGDDEYDPDEFDEDGFSELTEE